MTIQNTSPTFRFFDAVASIGATIAWCAIAVVTFVDVVGRNVFAAPIPGGYEIIQVLMTIGVFFSLPIVALRKSHVQVDLLKQAFPAWLARATNLLATVVAISFFAFLAWCLAKLALHAMSTGERTAFLFIPHWIIAVVMAVFLLATTFCCLIAHGAPDANPQDKEI